MGLDMYLYGVKYESNLHDYNIGAVQIKIQTGYWRKAYNIHHWFVENIQYGVNNCAIYQVEREELEELKQKCDKAITDHLNKKEILSVEELWEVKETSKICEQALKKDFDFFEYQSSW